MGGRLGISLAGALAFAAPAWAQDGGDACLEHCSLERQGDGTVAVLCACQERKYPHHDQLFVLRTRAPARYAEELEARLRGASEAEKGLVARDACGRVSGGTGPRATEELLKISQLAQRPLCECVGSRVHFALRRSCSVTKAGVELCTFAPDQNGRKGTLRADALRKPTLHDYQACIAARLNYRPAQSCAEAACTERPRACSGGHELVNIADEEACCPIFECRAREGAT